MRRCENELRSVELAREMGLIKPLVGVGVRLSFAELNMFIWWCCFDLHTNEISIKTLIFDYEILSRLSSSLNVSIFHDI